MTVAPEAPRHPRTARWRAAAVAACAVVFFVAVNIWADQPLQPAFRRHPRRLFTLSDNTRAVLRDLDEPVTLRLPRSPDLEGLAAATSAMPGGSARCSRSTPGWPATTMPVDGFGSAFSAAEEAVGAGIEGIANTAGTLYLGLIATNSTDGRQVIGHLSPNARAFWNMT